MDLQKIYTDSDFSSAIVPDGQLLIFNAIEDGSPVTRYKDSNGNFGTVSGNGGGTTVLLGQVNADGNFQALAFDGIEASNSGAPEAVENYYTFNGVLPVPDGGIHSGGTADFYKCASVDTTAQAWTGYKAVLTDGVYSFEDTATEGLSYGTAFTPELNSIYNSDATIKIDKLWNGVDPALVFYAPLASPVTVAETGQTMVNNGGVTFSDKGAYFTGSNYIEISDVSALPFDGVPLTMFAKLKVDDISSQFNHLLTMGNEIGFRYYDGLQVFWNGGDLRYNGDFDMNNMYKMCVSYDGNTVCFYVDGVLASSVNSAINIVNNGSLRIGGLPRYGNGIGYVADVRIYNRCLSSAEIAEL